MHTPTNEKLLIQAPELDALFEKQASIARMSDDEKRWPTQVLSELYKQLPFMSKFAPEIVLDRLDAEAGYALGYVQVRNMSDRDLAQEAVGKPSNRIRIPIIVSDRQLQPFHTFELGKRQYALTKDRIEAAMMNPAMFDGSGDLPGKQSLVDQINPPFQQRQGFGVQSGGDSIAGLSKLSSAPKEASWRSRALDAAADGIVGGAAGAGAGAAANPEDRKKGALHGAAKGAVTGAVTGGLGVYANRLAAKGGDVLHEKGHRTLARMVDLAGVGAGVAGLSAAPAAAGAYRKVEASPKEAGLNVGSVSAGRVAGKTRKLAPGLKKVAESMGYKAQGQKILDEAEKSKGHPIRNAVGTAAAGALFGSLGAPSVGKMLKKGSLCSKIAGTLNPTDFARFEAQFKDPSIRFFVEKSAAVQAALQDLMSEPLVSAADLRTAAVKKASIQRADVVQIRPNGDGYEVKFSSAPFDMAPQTAQVSPQQAGQMFPPEAMQVADQMGAATLTGVEATPDPLVEHPQPITGFGMYKVMEATTGKQLIGYVIPGLIDPRSGQPSGMSLFCNGSQFALQPNIVGILVNLNFNLPATPMVRGLGIFYKTDGRSLSATVPFQIITEMTVEGRKYYAAKGPDGQDVQIVMVNGMKQPYSMTGGMATGGPPQPGMAPGAGGPPQQGGAPGVPAQGAAPKAGAPASAESKKPDGSSDKKPEAKKDEKPPEKKASLTDFLSSKIAALPAVEVNIHNGKDDKKKDAKTPEKKTDSKSSSEKKPAPKSDSKSKAPQSDAAMAAPPMPQGPQEIAIPADWHFLALDNPVQLEGGQNMQQGALPMKTAQIDAWSTMCEIRAWDGHGCKLSGPVFEKIGSGEHSWVDGVFWLAAAGMPQNMAVDLLEKAASSGKAMRLFGLQPLRPLSETVKAASFKAMDDLFKLKLPARVCLLKEAAALSDTASVDAVLALNFINPENVSTFLENLPDLEDASSQLASLVLATQLGLQSIPKTAAVRAMFALEDVITGLKSMRSYPI